MPYPKRILIPIDGSYYSHRAFQWVMKNLFKPNDVIILVHVVEPPYLKSFSLKSGINIPVEELAEKVKRRFERAERLLAEYSNECIAVNAKHEYYILTSKSVGEGICQSSIDNNVDFIILGNEGLGRLRRTLLGSLSDFIISRSTVPVTIVPTCDD